MVLFGVALYLLLLILVVWFVKCAWGKSIRDLFAEDAHHHHRILAVNGKYPGGGTWSQHQAWLKEEAHY